MCWISTCTVEEQEVCWALYKLKGYKREWEAHDNGKFTLWRSIHRMGL